MQTFTKTYKKGSHLFHENDHSRELYIVQTGCIKVYRIVGNKEIELAMFSKGSVLGEMALIDGKARSASARAEQDSTVIIIDANAFLEKTKDAPQWFMTIIRMVSQKIRSANKRLNTVHEDSKGANIILSLYHQLVRYSTLAGDKLSEGLRADVLRNQTVQLLGITQNRVENSVDFLHEKGFIEQINDTIFIKNIDGIKQYCVYLRFMLHNAFDGCSHLSPAVGTLAVHIMPQLTDALEVQLKQVQMAGETLWPMVIAVVPEKSDQTTLITTLKDEGFIKVQKVEGAERKTEGEKPENPLAGFMLSIETECWYKAFLYHTYKGYVLPV